MSQEQPQGDQNRGIMYGDVFNVSGEIASKNIAPRDAAAMQSAENIVLGQTQKGGPASVMQSAADFNENIGVVGHDEATDITRDQGITIAERVVGDRRVIAEAVGGEVVGGYATTKGAGGGGGQVEGQGRSGGGEITIGEALEATAVAAGNRPVDASDAAAIQAAEVRATGLGQIMPGGIGAEAQAAANANPLIERYQDKTKLGDILRDATHRLPGDKPVTGEDAERVVDAETGNDPRGRGATHPGGVASALSTAAALNEQPNRP
ncbi:OLC1v1007273C1 [Oldenlandia corymbosa var. corymbosa]|uniref:OLC1v1007273C1 n=1 Tax=Oldenlandia corymbosa var. corymbosa TaxID=529605 RepID=A0AAV1DIT0_OLDCO|nr:OLC1v1007273C1 [Oldenlandia corymbosa var. corymbosa]